jgi:hypothetical protein
MALRLIGAILNWREKVNGIIGMAKSKAEDVCRALAARGSRVNRIGFYGASIC